MNVLDLAQKHVQLKKVATTKGGEWQGPCPGCGGSDRFHVWPEKNEGEGSYWCRQCEKSGDGIQFLLQRSVHKKRGTEWKSLHYCTTRETAVRDWRRMLGLKPTDPIAVEVTNLPINVRFASVTQEAEVESAWALI